RPSVCLFSCSGSGDLRVLHSFPTRRSSDLVCSGTASGSLDVILGLCPIPAGWLDQVEVVLAAGAVNIRVAGVLFFSTLVVGFDVGYLRPLVLGEAHDGILWLAQGRPSFLAIQSYW